MPKYNGRFDYLFAFKVVPNTEVHFPTEREFESFVNLKGWDSLTFVLLSDIFFQKHFEIGQVRIYPQPAYVLQICFFAF